MLVDEPNGGKSLSPIRFGRWIRAELGIRRKKLIECIVTLVIAQVIIFLFFLSPSQSEKNKSYVLEEQERVGKYIVLFTKPSTVHTTPRDDIRQVEGLRDKGRTSRLDVPISFPNNRTFAANEEVGGSEDPFGELSSVLLSRSKQQPDESEENEEDPVLGRGFQDEFATHRSDGNAVLLVDNHANVVESLEEEGGMFQDINDSVNEIKRSVEELPSLDEYDVNSHIEGDVDLPLPYNEFPAIPTKKEIISNNHIDRDLLASNKSREYRFKDFDDRLTQYYTLKDDEQVYFTEINNRTCFIKGTDVEKTLQTLGNNCSCLKYYYGEDCGVPEAAWVGLRSISLPTLTLGRRKVPRRVLNGLPVNHEFALFEARMHELHDVVDAFIILESNYSSHGDPKELAFLKRFKEGYLAEFQDKLLYIKLAFFSDQSKTSGWLADSYIRFYLGVKAMKRVKGLRDDDLFVLSDADELPTKEIITFLKLYDGYPEPVGFGLRWNVFNFHWIMPADMTLANFIFMAKEKLSNVYSAATVGMVRKVLMKNVFFIRKDKAWAHPQLAANVEKYEKEGHIVMDWVAGTIGHYAGWHCSWCFSPENIVIKMNAAQANDKPRWGDYPEKKNLTYITSRLNKGKWFDDQLQLRAVKNTKDIFYAPPYLLKHPEKYRSILYHPGHPLNQNNTWVPP